MQYNARRYAHIASHVVGCGLGAGLGARRKIGLGSGERDVQGEDDREGEEELEHVCSVLGRRSDNPRGRGLFIDFPPQHVMRLWRSCPPNAIKQRVSVRHVDGALMRSTGHPDIAPFPFQVYRSDGGLRINDICARLLSCGARQKGRHHEFGAPMQGDTASR